MRQVLCALMCLIIVLGPGVLTGGEKALQFSDVQSDLESEIAKLSAHINMFEYVLNKMDASARANFGDLKEKNRNKFYEVRIESLETSINQINNMHKQIQINYNILPPDFFEQVLMNTERKAIMSSIVSLEACIELLKSVNQN